MPLDETGRSFWAITVGSYHQCSLTADHANITVNWELDLFGKVQIIVKN